MLEKHSITLVQKVWKTKYLSWSNFSRILNQFKKFVVKLKQNQEINKTKLYSQVVKICPFLLDLLSKIS
jgi:hypothetical protein